MICEYGCKQKAKYQFKNGKWCCEKIVQKCPSIKEKNSLTNKRISKEDRYWFGKRLSEEHRKKISEKNKGTKKRPLPEEHRKKISKVHKGKIVSEETRNKISQSNSGKESPMFGKYHSEETKKKISKVHKGKIVSEETRNKMAKGTKKWWNNHPEQKENMRKIMSDGKAAYMTSCNESPSKPQIKIFNLVKEIYPESVLEYPIYKTNNSIDIALPSKMIAIEYDGSYWHQDKEYDNKRQKQLESLGWKFIRYRDYVPNKKEILGDIEKVLGETNG